MRMRVLVTDARLGPSYIVMRSLYKKGVKITAAGEKGRLNSVFYSKFCRDRVLYPSPDTNEEAFVKVMLKLAKKHELLIPIHERTIVPISKRLEIFNKITKVPIPTYEILRNALDKAKTLNVAKSIGVPIPQTYFVHDLSGIKRLSKRLKYPVVIKFRYEIFVSPPRYVYAYSPQELVAKYQIMHKKHKYPIIQELVPGTGYGFFALLNERSKPIAMFCHKRIREYPITGGPSTFCESVYEPTIIKYGLNILKSIKWYGVAMVEFRLDHRDGKFKLMEVNPRFWGSLPLAIASGVDFPYLLCQMALGQSTEPRNSYKLDIKCRFLFNDSLALIQALRERSNKFKYMWNFLKSFFESDVTYGDFSLEDPCPMAYSLASRIASKASRFRPRSI